MSEIFEQLEGEEQELNMEKLKQRHRQEREESKRIQLFMTVYLLTVHTVCLFCAAFNYDILLFDPRPLDPDCSVLSLPTMCSPATRQVAAISCIIFGWLPRVVLR